MHSYKRKKPATNEFFNEMKDTCIDNVVGGNRSDQISEYDLYTQAYFKEYI